MKLDPLVKEIELESDPHRLVKHLTRLKGINALLNELNIELHRAIRQEDTSFVSRTMIESTRYAPQKVVVLRAVTVNPLTTPEILHEIIEEHDRLGSKIYKSDFAGRLEKM